MMLLSSAETGGAVPAYRARLPRAEALLPYLRCIDANRWYTNRGALVDTFERRLSTLLGSNTVCVGSAASGTAALQAAVLAAAGSPRKDRSLAFVPAYTFAATALALQHCGYRPYLVDIEATDWALAPDRLIGHHLLASAGVVIPVAPYGRPPPQAAWRAFRDMTGIPVVIDAAAAFESVLADPLGTIGSVPITLSFQATKPFSTAEGGAVVWSDTDGLVRVASAVNFGFLYSRETQTLGMNGRMSEYHAAIGLAALDEWPAKAASHRAIADAYRSAAVTAGLVERVFVAPLVAACYALVLAPGPKQAACLIHRLTAEAIEHRLWYGLGLHRHRHFASLEADPLPVTQRLAPCLVGVPFFDDLPLETVGRIVACIAAAFAEAGPPA